MNPILLAAAGLCALLGLPLFLVLLGTTYLGQRAVDLAPEVMLVEIFDKLTENPIFLTIPLFAHAGFVLSAGKAPARLVELVRATLGWLPGGPAIVCVVTCALFTAFTGASGVTIIALGGLLLPLLLREGYAERYGLGLVTTGGSLGLLFPPSLPLIVFALIASGAAPVAVDSLFLAGLLPGALLLFVLGLHGAWVQRGSQSAERTPFQLSRALAALRANAAELPIPLLIGVGVFGGYVTVPQAAALVAAWVTLVELWVHKDLDLPALARVTVQSQAMVGAILVIIMAALALTNFLTDQEIPRQLLAAIETRIDSKLSFLIALNVFLLGVGCVMDIYSAILVVVPLVMPIALRFGVDPLHLGIVFLTNLEIGYSTPPVGINLFISSLRFERPVFALYRASLPFLGLLLACLLVITWFPGLSLGLVRLVEGTGSVEISWERREGAGGSGGSGTFAHAQRPADSSLDWFELSEPGEGAARAELDDLVLRYRPQRADDLEALLAGEAVPLAFELARSGEGGARISARFELEAATPEAAIDAELEVRDVRLQPADPDVPAFPEEAYAVSSLRFEGVREGALLGRLRATAIVFPDDPDASESVHDLELAFACTPELDALAFREPGPEARSETMRDVRLSARTLEGATLHVLERTRTRPHALYASWRSPASEAGEHSIDLLRLAMEELEREGFPPAEAQTALARCIVEAADEHALTGRIEAVLQAAGATWDVRVRYALPLRTDS